MPINNLDTQLKQGFFHSTGRVLTENSNLIGNELYKSAHNISSNEIWIDTISYSPDYITSVSISDNLIVKQIGTVSDPVYLYPLTKSNYQSWFIDSGTPSLKLDGFEPSENWIKSLISPVDVTNEIGLPSFGFEFQLYKPDGVRIPNDFGYYEVDYYSGLVRFDVNKTPKDSLSENGLNFQFSQSSFESVTALGNTVSAINYIKSTTTGGPRCVTWQYVGKRLNDLSSAAQPVYEVTSPTSAIGSDNNGESTGFTLSKTPSDYSRIEVYINGQRQLLGDGDTTKDCWFGTANSSLYLSNLTIGAELYWNSESAGFNLESSDRLEVIYES